MWVLIDAFSNERLSERFPSQAELARFMGFSPKALNKAVNEGKNVFPFRGREGAVVEQKVARFSVHETPTGPPLESFETEAEMAQWVGVTRQAIYAAFHRFCDFEGRKVRNDGKTYFMKRIFDKGPLTNPWTEEATPIPKKQHAISVKIISSTSTKVYPSVSAATNDLGIDSRTIHAALKSGRNSFTRRSDGEKFQVEKVEILLSTLPPKPISQSRKKEAAVSAPRPRKKAASVSPLTEEERKCRFGENFRKMKLKYPEWVLNGEVDVKKQETKTVLFNPETGEDIPVNGLRGLEDYFDSRKYAVFPDQVEYNSTITQGTWKFQTKTSERNIEDWIRFIFVRA